MSTTITPNTSTTIRKDRVTPSVPETGYVAADSHDFDDEEAIGSPPITTWRTTLAILVLLGAAAAGLVALFYLGWMPRVKREADLYAASEKVKNELPRVQVAKPRQSPAITSTLLPGDVRASEETNVYPRTSGYLKRWLVDLGDEVEQGQLLAEIDTPEVDQELRQAEAVLGQLKAKLLTAKANLRLAETTLDRYESLPKNTISSQELDERRATVDTTKTIAAAAEADVTAGLANVRRITELRSFAKVTAPFGGTIIARDIETGQLVTTGNSDAQALFRLARTNPARVFVNVPQAYAPGVQVGLKAEVIVRETPGQKFVGKVTRTARAIDPQTRTLLTEIQVPNEDHALLTGSYVQVQVDLSRVNPPLLVPASALIVNSDGTRIAVIDNQQQIHFKTVQVDGDYNTDLGISGGLTLEDLVVTNPSERLTEGGRVRVDAPAVAQTTSAFAK